ncbi:MAG: DUF2911 domain-containing protein [Bacteroidetes bacterium]|nr:DUF2911 domain-containing protein [Bacteroidota bacterium]
MKKLFILFLIASFAAQAQVITPAPSPGASVTTVVGLTDVKVEYSRPKAKGRKIFGQGTEYLVQYGQIWRTGANAGTKVTFGDDVKVGTSDVPKGTYLLLTIPGATEWTVIFYKDASIGGDMTAYKQANDQARVTVKADKLTEKVETFTIEISDLAENSKTANIQLAWENTSVKIPLTVDFDSKVMKSIEANTKVNPNNLFAAGVYYFENGKDQKQALEWVSKAADANPDFYWMSYQKARIQKAMGDKAGATTSANASKAAASKAGNQDYVKLNDELLKGLK